MRRLVVLLVCLIGFVVACRADVMFIKVHNANFIGYIVPQSAADGWMREYNDPKWIDDGGAWQPTAAQCIESEKAVSAFMRSVQKDPATGFPGYPADAMKWKQKQVEEIAQRYSTYQVQFAGIVVGGHHEIFCNYFCLPANLDLDPTNNFIFVNDGGSRFWQIVYDPATKTCSRLMINGNA